MGREKPAFPIEQSLCHNAKVVHAFESNTPFEKLPGTQINVPLSIAPAAPPVPHFPRFRALALFGRRSPQCVDSLVMPASENLHNSGPSQTRRLRRGHSKVPISVHPRRAGWGDVRIHARVRSAGAAAARAATAFSDGSRQPGGHGWIWRIPQRFLPLQPKRQTVLLLLLRVSSQSTSEAVLN